MLLQFIDVHHWFLINTFLRVSFSQCLHWCGFHAARGESEWGCDILLLKQFLPDICQAAGNFCFPAHHACRRALSCCDTILWTSYQMWHPNRPDQIIDCHERMHLSETARDVDHHWWAVVINRTYCIAQGRVEAPIRIGGQLCCSSTAHLLQCLYVKNYQNTRQFALFDEIEILIPGARALSHLWTKCEIWLYWKRLYWSSSSNWTQVHWMCKGIMSIPLSHKGFKSNHWVHNLQVVHLVFCSVSAFFTCKWATFFHKNKTETCSSDVYDISRIDHVKVICSLVSR